MPVAVHEYSHFLFSQMPAARFQKVRDNVLGVSDARPSMERLGAWSLFNEALATAICALMKTFAHEPLARGSGTI